MQAGLVDHHALGGKPIPPSALVGYKRVLPGEIVMNRMRASAGLFAAAASDGLVSPDYAIFRPVEPVNVAYAVQLFRTPAMRAVFRLESTGLGTGESGFLRLYSDQFGRLAIPTPPIAEQAAIMKVLNWANERLDRAIRAKRKVIALLTEQKQGIIHRAVTLGLDHDITLKPTGVSCLGGIPQHWQQRALWTLGKLRTERNPGGLPLLSVFLDRGVIRYEDGGGQVHAPSLNLTNYQVVRTGDFVLNNQQAWRGSVGVSSHNGIISPAYIVFQLSGSLDCRYANHLMRSKAMVNQFVVASKGVGDIQRSVFWPFLRMVQVPLPSTKEQQSIVQYIEQATAGLDATIVRLNREIELVLEYRTRLTSDVVSGKLDVREAAQRILGDATLDAGEEPVREGDAELSDEVAAA